MNQEPSFSLDGVTIRWRDAARGGVALIGLLVLGWLLGPLSLLLAWLIQRWAAREIWQARDRWASVGGFAWLFGAIGILLLVAIYLPLPAFTSWLAFFWDQLPRGWDTPLRVVVLRWGILLLLAPLLAVLLEMLHPRTVWSPRRLLTEAEHLHLQAEAARQQAEAMKKQAAAQARAEQAAKRKARQAAARSQSDQDQEPPASAAAAHVQLALPIEPPAPDATSRTSQAHQEQEPPETSAVLEPKSEAPPKRSTYDWDHGEGTVRNR
ncbi:hypothetical protein KDH_80070 [Dictyobacter sp. S3.2.2.5]|uniref:Uncharacterized protein n=1 Tax=Dictyobacter halimunensis TaxID=3026934 RepID=A0ABQ6G5T9_9CHLR|nr:hypothetical protein KDH_80070 [Dictyobacter sp. S3.2.2.5]